MNINTLIIYNITLNVEIFINYIKNEYLVIFLIFINYIINEYLLIFL